MALKQSIITSNQILPENKPDNDINIIKPVWISVSEAAKLGGVQNKTIRRAIQFNHVKYKIVSNRYQIDFSTLIAYLHTKTKLKNKLNQFGLGQYVDKWK